MKVIIIGGGPAGCAAAYTLHKHGHEITLFEAAEQVGGRTRQLLRDGFNLATGALFLMGGIYPRTSALLAELDRTRELRPWGGASELVDADTRRYPVNFVNLASYLKIPVLGLADRLRLAREGLKLLLGGGAKNPFDGHELARFDTGETLEHWSRGHLGNAPHEYMVRPIMDFLYAVPADWLSTPFPLAIVRQAHKMRLSVPPLGVGQVSHWLIAGSPRARVQLSTRVERIERQGSGFRVHANGQWHDADRLIVATEAFTAARLLRDLIPEQTARTLTQTPYTDYAHVALGYERNPWPHHPADIVLPVGPGETRTVGAVVLHSRRQPGSAPPGGELAGVYFNTPPLAHLSDDDLRHEALTAVTQAFGVAPPPTFIHLFRYDRGLTIAGPGHYGRLDAVHGALPEGIELAGDYFSQAGVEAAVLTGERAALKLQGLAPRLA